LAEIPVERGIVGLQLRCELKIGRVDSHVNP
jgi:hypothetical protein